MCQLQIQDCLPVQENSPTSWMERLVWSLESCAGGEIMIDIIIWSVAVIIGVRNMIVWWKDIL